MIAGQNGMSPLQHGQESLRGEPVQDVDNAASDTQ